MTVSAEDGVLGAVTMVKRGGRPGRRAAQPDGLTWATTEPLGYNKRYTLNAQSLGLGGVTSQQMTFQTHSPENLTMPYVLPNDGEVVGVGQPVAVRFDENIPNRLAAEKAITVTTNPPVEGAFYWLNNREVRWRPANTGSRARPSTSRSTPTVSISATGCSARRTSPRTSPSATR